MHLPMGFELGYYASVKSLPLHKNS